MSLNFPGVPLGPEPDERRSALRTFGRIPRLRDHLPGGGWPGVTYAQVAIRNLKAASDRRERPANLRELRGGAIYFTVEGPKGSIDCALVGTGKPIPGGQPDAGNRLFFTDGEIGVVTGLEISLPIWLRPEEEYRAEVESAQERDARAGEDSQGDERVQARGPAQREPERTRGPVAKAGGRDRDVRGRAISEEERRRRSERMKAMHERKRMEKRHAEEVPVDQA